MATEQYVTSDSLDSTVVAVPRELHGYVKTSIIDYMNKAAPEEFSANIHYAEGQSPKLEVSFGGQQPKSTPSSDNDLKETKSIVVKNIPESVDEELLEIFFESTKKQGGGPVKSVKMLSDTNAAFVEFCDRKSVETVLNKMPIKYGRTELEIKPFKPILRVGKKIKTSDLKGLPIPDAFTDGLEKKQLQSIIPCLAPEHGPELFDLLKVGSRVIRGRDWGYSWNCDVGSGGQATITDINPNGSVTVRWDVTGNKTIDLPMGKDGEYALKLAP